MSKLTSGFVEKYRNWQKIVRQNNGIVGTFLQLFRLVTFMLKDSNCCEHLTDFQAEVRPGCQGRQLCARL